MSESAPQRCGCGASLEDARVKVYPAGRLVYFKQEYECANCGALWHATRIGRLAPGAAPEPGEPSPGLRVPS